MRIGRREPDFARADSKIYTGSNVKTQRHGVRFDKVALLGGESGWEEEHVIAMVGSLCRVSEPNL